MAPTGKRNIKKEHYLIRDALTLEKRSEILKYEFGKRVGYELDLDDPKTFNEKIMWLKLYYQDPRITVCCDKYALKDYVREKAGDRYNVPVIASWEKASDIDFDALPERFVLKVNWSSGYNIIVRDKSTLDVQAARAKLDSWTMPDRNCYYQYFNWGYRNMKPVIYAEEYITQTGEQLYDYKLYFSKGEFICMFIATDRYSGGLTYTFFDRDLKVLPFTYGGKPNADPLPALPDGIDEMMETAKILADDFPFVRVDFYQTDTGRIYVGEMTFYSGGGILRFDPPEWDRKMGDLISLPEKLITEE